MGPSVVEGTSHVGLGSSDQRKVPASLSPFLKSEKIPALLYIGKGPEYKPFCDFWLVPSACRPCAQISNHGRASTQALLLYIMPHQTTTGMERYIGCFKSVVPNTLTYRVHKTLPLWKHIRFNSCRWSMWRMLYWTWWTWCNGTNVYISRSWWIECVLLEFVSSFFFGGTFFFL